MPLQKLVRHFVSPKFGSQSDHCKYSVISAGCRGPTGPPRTASASAVIVDLGWLRCVFSGRSFKDLFIDALVFHVDRLEAEIMCENTCGHAELSHLPT